MFPLLLSRHFPQTQASLQVRTKDRRREGTRLDGAASQQPPGPKPWCPVPTDNLSLCAQRHEGTNWSILVTCHTARA